MIHCHGVEIFKAELEKFLASIFLNDDILNDVLFRQVFKEVQIPKKSVVISTPFDKKSQN